MKIKYYMEIAENGNVSSIHHWSQAVGTPPCSLYQKSHFNLENTCTELTHLLSNLVNFCLRETWCRNFNEIELMGQ